MSNRKQTRIINKHDIEANWEAANFTPMKGELIIYDAEDSNTELPSNRYMPIPYQRCKIGDGITTTQNLPFLNTTKYHYTVDRNGWYRIAQTNTGGQKLSNYNGIMKISASRGSGAMFGSCTFTVGSCNGTNQEVDAIILTAEQGNSGCPFDAIRIVYPGETQYNNKLNQAFLDIHIIRARDRGGNTYQDIDIDVEMILTEGWYFYPSISPETSRVRSHYEEDKATDNSPTGKYDDTKGTFYGPEYVVTQQTETDKNDKNKTIYYYPDKNELYDDNGDGIADKQVPDILKPYSPDPIDVTIKVNGEETVVQQPKWSSKLLDINTDLAKTLANITTPKLKDLESDSTHRTVSDKQIADWNAKSDFSGDYYDLDNKPDLENTYLKQTNTAANSTKWDGYDMETVTKLPDKVNDNTIYFIISK